MQKARGTAWTMRKKGRIQASLFLFPGGESWHTRYRLQRKSPCHLQAYVLKQGIFVREHSGSKTASFEKLPPPLGAYLFKTSQVSAGIKLVYHSAYHEPSPSLTRIQGRCSLLCFNIKRLTILINKSCLTSVCKRQMPRQGQPCPREGPGAS